MTTVNVNDKIINQENLTFMEKFLKYLQQKYLTTSFNDAKKVFGGKFGRIFSLLYP